VLVEREGERVNHKRLWRVYREAALCLKRKKRRHCVRVGSPRQQLSGANQEWALDFVHDVIAAGRTIRVLSDFARDNSPRFASTVRPVKTQPRIYPECAFLVCRQCLVRSHPCVVEFVAARAPENLTKLQRTTRRLQ
jgi:hypothetical protein